MAIIPGHATEIRYQRTGPLAGRYYHKFRPGVRMRANTDGSVTLRGRRRIHATEDEPGFWRKYGGHRANPFRSFVTRAKSAYQREGQRGINWTFDGMNRTDRDAFDRFLVTTKDPLAYEAGTQESRFNRYVKRNPERRCKRCGTPTVFKGGICRYCQRPEEKSQKASERGNPRRPAVRAFCLRCLGGGKFLGTAGSQRAADVEATSHMRLYGHPVTILPAKGTGNPRPVFISEAQARAMGRHAGRFAARHDSAGVDFQRRSFVATKSLAPRGEWPMLERAYSEGYREESGFRNPHRRRSPARPRRSAPSGGLPWGWIFAGVLFWTWSLHRDAAAASAGAGDTMPGGGTVSTSDVVRGMQAEAEALAAAAAADGSSYTSLSDYLRSGAIGSTISETGWFF